MEMMDRSLEQRVWQRVEAPYGEAAGDGIPSLYHRCRCREQTYRRLTMQAGHALKPGLQNLARMEQAEGECLLGILKLRFPGFSPGKAEGETGSLEKLLPRLYREAMTTWQEYTALSFDREFGGVFAALAGRKQTQGAEIMALMGRLPGTSEKIQK